MRVTIIALVLAVGLAANATMSEGQQDNQKLGGCNLRCRHLRFIGEGSVPVKPKWALLDLSVEVNSLQLQGGSSNNSGGSSGGSGGDKTAMAKQVRDEAQHRSAFILNYLKDLKMEDIKDFQTQEMSFVPMYDDQRTLIGYKATFGLSFKVALDKLQEVLDHIVSESGANRLNSIVFVADEDDEKQANIKAIELATQNAWDQAQAITKVFGIQGNLKLLSVREKIQPLKRIIRRIAARRLMDSDMGMDDNDDDNNEGGDFSMLKLLKGDTIVNARLVFNFDFEDGTISFQQVQPIESNFTVADTFGGLLKGGANETKKQPQQPGETQAVQPANNATAPNTTAAAQPGVTQPVQPGVTQPPAQPQPQPT